MAGSARNASKRLVEASALAALCAVLAGLAASRARGVRRDGIDPLGRILRQRRRPRRDAPETDGVPVTPNRPLDLSGGAAAALEFDS